MSAALANQIIYQDKFIINHDIMHCTAEGVVGNHLYSGRALGISDPVDIIQLSPELKPLWPAIQAHYERVGLKFSREVLWNVDMKALGQHVGYQPSVFYYGPQQGLNWGDFAWLDTVEFINSKNNFALLAQELDVPIPLTIGFESIHEINDKTIAAIDFPCYLKAAVSVAGVGIYRCADSTEFRQAMSRFDHDVPVQIQQEIISTTFLNMQYKAEHGKAIRLACSEQILDGFTHQGNKFPASYTPWEKVDPMAEWLVNKGIQGIFAFDVAVVETPEGPLFPAIECNPRFNGACYPTLIAQKLGIEQWQSRTYTTHYRDLDSLPIQALEYDARRGYGIILVNWGTILEGRLMILLAGTSSQMEDLDKELQSLLE